jgi:DNA helicase-2/ATP-dependent DNA helicase PcrA
MEYTTAQKRAIKTLNQNLQIIACAGSGKTQVISQRIVEFLKGTGGHKASPGDIVAFTFTEKAAGELKERIRRTALNDGLADTGFSDMFVGTIHAYCLRILQPSAVARKTQPATRPRLVQLAPGPPTPGHLLPLPKTPIPPA